MECHRSQVVLRRPASASFVLDSCRSPGDWLLPPPVAQDVLGSLGEGKTSGVAFLPLFGQGPFPLLGSARPQMLSQIPNSRIPGFPLPSPESLKAGMWDQFFYQKVQGGCSSSKVGMLVTLTGMEMMAHGSPCCSKERRIM